MSGVIVGHSFVSLSTNFGGSDSNITFGYHPSSDELRPNEGDGPDTETSPMQIQDNSNHVFSVSSTVSVSCSDFNTLLFSSINETYNSPTYDLSNYNCTNYAIEIGNSINLGIPTSVSPWMFRGTQRGASANPGDLGEDIRNIPNATVLDEGGAAPATNCN